MAESTDDLLAEARTAIGWRPTAAELAGVLADGAYVVDIRPVYQRARDGEMPGAAVVDRNVLEWRLDPHGDHRLPDGPTAGQVVVVVCNEGYASSLAAATLRRLGLDATDLDGGFQGWRKLRSTGG